MIAARLPFIAIALVCAALGVYLAASSRGEGRLDGARADVLAGRETQALATLDRLDGEQRGRAAALRGRAHLARGDLQRARRAFQTAARRDPNNWALQRDYGVVLLRVGERSKARARMRRALALNPRMLLPPGFVAQK